jgi:hypothetical protein
MSTRLEIDLSFSLTEPTVGGEASEGEAELLSGTISASGTDVAIYVSDPSLVAGRRQFTLEALRALADEIAGLGLSVSLSGPDGLIGRLGNVQSSLVQRTMTGSQHIQFSTDGILTALRGLTHASDDTRRIPLPPTTPFPFAPTFGRRARRRATTTHYQPGSGRPRLIFVVGSENWDGTPPREFNLLPGTTTIGSSEDADLRLEGLDDIHAQIVHDDDDEYCLSIFGQGEANVAAAFDERGQKLRTGARIELGAWRMAYFREEFADHGRPFGGRSGGEGSHQKRQPPRR